MVKGQRVTHNMVAILHPGKDSVVKIGRHNARVDEGYNQIVCLNPEVINSAYGGWVQVIDSMAHGEASIIVRNNSEQSLRLPAGFISIAVRPAIEIPRAMSATEFESSLATTEEPEILQWPVYQRIYPMMMRIVG